MKTLHVLLLLCFIFGFGRVSGQKKYVLVQKKTGKVNSVIVNTLPPNLKSLAAFYSALGGTNCQELKCDLTTDLGLGKQGSDAHKQLILKYFPDDKVAKLVIGQDCYLAPSTSSSFSNFNSLEFIVDGQSVRVNYELMVYEHGNTKLISGPDLFTFKNQIFKNKKRVLYAWADK